MMSLSSVGTYVPSEKAGIGHSQGKKHLDQHSLVSSIVQDDWMEQV